MSYLERIALALPKIDQGEEKLWGRTSGQSPEQWEESPTSTWALQGKQGLGSRKQGGR